jgi:ABC-2 type transport system permease protein
MGHIVNLMRWEWFKLRKRWMPWIILAIILLYTQVFGVWSGFVFYRMSPSSEAYADLKLPQGLIDSVTAVCSQFGVILIIVLTASVIGTEYRWGTIRLVLAKGTGRWQYLASKVLLIWLLVAGALLIVMAASAISSLIAGALAGGAPEGASISARWVDVPIAFGKASFFLLPYIALATFFTVLTTSSAAGMAISVVLYLADTAVAFAFLEISRRLETAVSYMLGWNAGAWITMGDAADADVGDILNALPSATHAFLVLTAYILLLGGLALWLFQRRDVAAK